MKTFKLSRINKTYVLFLITLFFLNACFKSMPTEKVEEASEVKARDNGNQGNASDIEIRYHQFGLDQISEYHIFIIKAENVLDHDIKYLQDLGPSSFMVAGPNDVIPSRGKRLPIDLVDSDGDEIIENRPYRAAVISLPLNPETHLPCIAYSEQDLILKSNHLVSNFSVDFEIGAGGLGVNDDGTVLMASYHFINDLSDSEFYSSNFVLFDSDGTADISVEDFPYLGGVGTDKAGKFYISNTAKGEIIKVSTTGDFEIVEYEGVDIINPDGIYMDESENMFIADRSGSIYKITPNGISTFVVNVGEGLRGLTGDGNGNLYATTNTEEGKIIAIYPNRQTRTLATIPTYVPSDYLAPFKMWLGYLTFKDGLLYVAGTSTDRIYTVNMNGEVGVFAGTGERQIPYGDILTADFNRPMGLAFSPDGKTLYVSGCEDTVPLHTQASTPSRVYRIELVE